MSRTPSRRSRAALALGSTLLTAAALAPASASAAFTCEATALKGSVAGGPVIEPIVANRGAANCATAQAGIGSLTQPLPGPLQAAVLSASTLRSGPADRPDLEQHAAAGGVAGLRVGALSSLGLTLPISQVPLPDALKTITVDISSVTGPINALPVQPPAPLPQLPDLIPDLPTSLVVDVEAAARELLKLPSTDVLGVRSSLAYAIAGCQNGVPITFGAREVAGLNVLGTEIDANRPGDQAIVDTQNLSLRDVTLAQVQVPLIEALVPGLAEPLISTVNAGIRPLVAAALAGAPTIAVPVDLARVRVTPGTQTKTATSLVQSAIGVQVSVLGQSVVDLALGEARVGTAGADCSPPAAPVVAGPTTAAQAALACTSRRLVLVDVVRRGSRVVITGAADKRFVGEMVDIRFQADGRSAGKARVSSDGSFATTAPLPSSRLRSSDRARYQAVLGREKSLNLKLARRMVVSKLTAKAGKVTIAGRVTRPLGSPRQTITLTRRVSCSKSEVVKRFKPAADGSFRVTVAAPKGETASVYRLKTKVRKTSKNPKLFDTFTLPRGVDLTS